VYPTSKAKTADYLYLYQGRTISTQSIYRFLDRLNDKYSLQAQQIATKGTGSNLVISSSVI
jgi:hypothetical protein